MKSRSCRRIVPISLSQYAFAFGARTGVFMHLQPERQELLIQLCREDRIAIVDQELVTVVAGKGFTKLRQRPGGSRMGSDIAVQNPPRPNFHQHEDVQLAKARSYHD